MGFLLSFLKKRQLECCFCYCSKRGKYFLSPRFILAKSVHRLFYVINNRGRHCYHQTLQSIHWLQKMRISMIKSSFTNFIPSQKRKDKIWMHISWHFFVFLKKLFFDRRKNCLWGIEYNLPGLSLHILLSFFEALYNNYLFHIETRHRQNRFFKSNQHCLL